MDLLSDTYDVIENIYGKLVLFNSILEGISTFIFGLSIFILSALFFILIATYILESAALFALAKNRGLKNAAIA